MRVEYEEEMRHQEDEKDAEITRIQGRANLELAGERDKSMSLRGERCEQS
jgi:hypothetical protein